MSGEPRPGIAAEELDDRARRSAAYLLLSGGMGDSYPDITMEHLGLEELPREGVVLNIGIGVGLTLEEYAKQTSPDLQIISFDFNLTDPYEREGWLDVQKEKGLSNHLVAGLAQELPFASDSFDLIVSHAAVPVYLGPEFLDEPEKHLRAFYSGIWRILKKGAEFRAAPILEKDADLNRKIMEEVGIPASAYRLEEFTTTGPRTGQPEKWTRLILAK